MRWSDIEDEYIILRQSKTDVEVFIYLTATLSDVLSQIPKVGPYVLTTRRRSTPWTESGFRASQRKAIKGAQIERVTFHDLRGTWENRADEVGCTEAEAAVVSDRVLSFSQFRNAYFSPVKGAFQCLHDQD